MIAARRLVGWIWASAAIFCGTLAGAQDAGIPFDRSFVGFGWNWQGSGETVLFLALRDYQGRVAVCGIYYSTGPVPLAVERKALRGTRVVAGGRTLLRDLSFLDEVEEDSDPARVRAPCKLSRHSWQDAYAQRDGFDIRAPRSVEH